MQSETESSRNAEAEQLTNEIYHVYGAVSAIIPDVHRRIGLDDPDWILLEPKKKNSTEKQATMRDYVLHQHATVVKSPNLSVDQIKQQAIACPLSFNTTSNPWMFDIDHFYPRANIMVRLENIELDQALLRSVKIKLEEKIKTGIFDKIEATGAEKTRLLKKIVSKIIPEKNGQLKVTGLKNLYHNYPKNLWPLSRPVNSEKQAQSPLLYAAEMTFLSLHTYAHEENFELFRANIQEEFGVDDDDMRNLSDDAKKELFLCQRLVDGFTSHAVQSPFILPHMFDDERFVGELDFFKRTILGQTAENYCSASAELTIRSMTITTNCLKRKPEYRSGIKAIFKCLNKAIAEETDSISSGSDLGLPDIKVMSATHAQLSHTIEKYKINHPITITSPMSTQHSTTSEKTVISHSKNQAFFFTSQSKNKSSICTKMVGQKPRKPEAQDKTLESEQEKIDKNNSKRKKRGRSS